MKIVYILISVALVMALLECEPVEAGFFRKIGRGVKGTFNKAKNVATKATKALKKREKLIRCLASCAARSSKPMKAFCVCKCSKHMSPSECDSIGVLNVCCTLTAIRL